MNDFLMDNFLKAPLSRLVKVPIIAVYKYPKDYPNKYVARLWDIKNKPTMYVVIKDSLKEIRAAIPCTLTRIPPMPEDDPVLVETYL